MSRNAMANLSLQLTSVKNGQMVSICYSSS